MIHNTKKKALYEVIGRAGLRPGYEQLHPNGTAGTDAGQSPSAGSTSSPQQAQGVVRWAIRPSVVQFNAGRVEFSIPYQVGIAVLLGVLLTAVVLFRLGERVGSREVAAKAPAVTMPVVSKPVSPKPVTQDTPVVKQPTAQDTSVAEVSANQPISTAGSGQAPPAGSVQGGRNRIVLKIYQVRSHLEPAKEYFDKMGVATEIIEKNNWYYLVTKNKYDNPEKAGTDGNLAKQKIVEIGSGYKAPAGFESFGPKPFSDAFGMRFDE
jgi:hypothetical protein